MSATLAATARSARSLSVSAGRLKALSGRLMPLSPASFSPLSRAWVISTSSASGCTRRITPPMRPSSNQIRSPAQTWVNTSGSVQATDGGAAERAVTASG